eukprot:TRINITY_DN4505_c0_g4_i2.p1 TRINITY_DN4505_c0_g4~~TRINITY_DN4505_c0_g4_i2.p1  ORF type:complete len:184 (+),score=39.50 TRINITY_DN4505_c0_g4_i2:587-1138(+)
MMIPVIVTPMEGIKARLQVQYNSAKSGVSVTGAPQYRGPIDCIKQLLRGPLGLWRGVYRGWAPTMFCRMCNFAYFGPYEFFRRKLGGEAGKLSLGASVVAGGCTGICYWLSCYPMDVIKNKIQAAPDVWPPKYRGVAHVAKEIYAAEGLAGFFRGFTPCILRAVPANASCFIAFEIVMHFLPQ